MLVIPELQIETVLKKGFSALPQQVSLLNDLLSQYPKEMVEEAKAYLRKHSVKVVLNWPQTGITEPQVAIVNGSSNEAAGNDALGNFLDQLQGDPGDVDVTEVVGFAEQGSYQIICISQDPRLTIYIAMFVKSLLTLNAMQLVAAGMQNVLLGTADVRLEEELLPEFSYSRVVTLSCLHYHGVAVTDRLLEKLVVTVTPAAPAVE